MRKLDVLAANDAAPKPPARVVSARGDELFVEASVNMMRQAREVVLMIPTIGIVPVIAAAAGCSMMMMMMIIHTTRMKMLLLGYLIG